MTVHRPNRGDKKTAIKKHPLHSAWKSMIARCHTPKDKSYGRYGAIGVRVCEEWHRAEGFWRFVEHMGPKPSPDHSLDRFPDRHGNYEPGNVRWATTLEQQNNRADNVRITINGVERTASEWARENGIDPSRISCRIRHGWDPAEAATERTDGTGRKHTMRLTQEIADSIRREHADGVGPYALANKHGVVYETVRLILKNKIWRGAAA